MKRRTFLAIAPAGAIAAASTAAILTSETPRATDVAFDALPDAGTGGFLNSAEARMVGAAFDRLIPADDLSIGAVEAGCVTFLDRQLAGNWGHATTRYRLGPNEPGTPEQGDQSPFTPRDRYRLGLAAMASRAHTDHGKDFADLPPQTQDRILAAMERGEHGADAKFFFAMLLQNVREGYFADPLYGGNKDMAGWKLVGFPGARYDYRLEIDRPGEDLKLAPISLMDRA
ncbi:gluconate 2-dehydrogenase subunit 3 family protein [Sphingomonas immobilis]|uniref:Gluconate 2-dehydrogenase subunit 3 family protein n=1 Tax=Sphingomonas immobilis TaxID=3063997 RepID=A0ABT8ZY44_9SPHN|nr:gluconate 2-dehydrogenase subunit 3 family protein [Sphingomonas sp. CA1-15]MDO7842498.1 gluconate 2-dehydrogenase subunit 3 family protein [Sphingomonas sp. CA1-15]